jgi:hypothetical protein
VVLGILRKRSARATQQNLGTLDCFSELTGLAQCKREKEPGFYPYRPAQPFDSLACVATVSHYVEAVTALAPLGSVGDVTAFPGRWVTMGGYTEGFY